MTKENFHELVSSAKSILKPNDDSKNVPEEIGEFRKAFEELLKKAGVKQLIVLVDDLDRCLPETAIENTRGNQVVCLHLKNSIRCCRRRGND